MASTGVTRVTGIDPSTAIKAPCKVATTGNVALEGEQTIDGVALTETRKPKTRVLVHLQDDPKENGVYDVKSTAWTRSDDFDGNRDVVKGTLVGITDGDTQAGKFLQVTTEDPITIGVSDITFGDVTEQLQQSYTLQATTVAAMKAIAGLTVGQAGRVIETNEHTAGAGYRGANRYVIQPVTADPDNGGTLIKSVASPAVEFVGMSNAGQNVLQWGVIPDSSTDNFTALDNAISSMEEGSVLTIPSTVGPNTTVDINFSATLDLPLKSFFHLKGEGRNLSKIVQTTTGQNGLDTNNVFATSKRGQQISDMWISTTPGVGQYGINWAASITGNLRDIYLEGWTAGLRIDDSFTNSYNRLFFAGGIDGIVAPSGFNDAHITECQFESQSQYGIHVTSTPAQVNIDGCSFQAINKGGIWFIAGYDIVITNCYFEGNFDGTAGTFDIKLGTSVRMRGGKVSNNYFFGTGDTNHYPLRLGNLHGAEIFSNVVTNGSHYIEFLNDNIFNCRFGSVTLENGVIDKSQGISATYGNMPNLFVHNGNIMEDYETFPCGNQNFFVGDFPYGGWATGGTGTATFTRSPNAGSVPDEHQGRPVLLIDQTAGSNAVVLQGFTIGPVINNLARGNWVTFMVDVLVGNASDRTFELILVGVSSPQVTEVFTANDADGFQTYALSFYVSPAEISISAQVNATAVAQYKVANPRLYVGMDKRQMNGVSGAPRWEANAAPTTGTWAVGDRVWDSVPVSLQQTGWVCTVAGTPGTWVAMANLA